MILVTGGAGYIGSHTCVQLLNAGYEVAIVDNLSNSKIEVISKIKEITGKTFLFYQIDLLNEEELENVFRENKINAVIHFAGYKAVGESVNLPLIYYHNNITSTLILCKLMDKFGVKQLVFSSSATVYGNPASVPIFEHFPLSTTNPYGATKLMIEQILRDLGKSDVDWSIALLRYFNPIGAHKSGMIGEDPNGLPNNLLPYISKVAVGELPHVNVFGNDYDTKDGTGIRDYIHVEDLSSGHVKALEKVINNKGVEAYNLGTGKGYSVLEIIRTYEKVSGKSINFKITSRRQGDIAQCFADTQKARKQLGWHAVKNIEEMCEDSWNFVNKNSQISKELYKTF